jgi:hypothetical protein
LSKTTLYKKGKAQQLKTRLWMVRWVRAMPSLQQLQMKKLPQLSLPLSPPDLFLQKNLPNHETFEKKY